MGTLFEIVKCVLAIALIVGLILQIPDFLDGVIDELIGRNDDEDDG